MPERISVGLDVHAASISACALNTETAELFRHRFDADPGAVTSWIRSLPGHPEAVYEAGPTGFDLSRFLNAAGIRCLVAAPSKLQRPVGDKVKTDARDALHLARLLAIGQITAVRVPSVEQEGARDLFRAHEDCRGELMSARHRLSKLLLRHSLRYSGKTWGGPHEGWLRQQQFSEPGIRLAFEDYLESVLQLTARKHRLERAITVMARDCEYTPLINRLGALRGVSAVTGFGLAVELGDWQRFTGKTIGSFVGLVPSESSSGTHRSQGHITKVGNAHARRLLVEAAWQHKRPYLTPGATMNVRWKKTTPAAAARGDLGNRRLKEQWDTFLARGMKKNVANTAVARQFAGWCWSLAVMDD